MLRRLIPRVAGFSTYSIKRNPRGNSAFKAVFKDKVALKSLLSAVYGTKIVELDYLSSYIYNPAEHNVRFDLYVRDANGLVFIVEFVKAMVDMKISRWIYYAAREYCTQKHLQPVKKTKREKKPPLKSMEFDASLLPVRLLVVYDTLNPEVTKMLDSFLPNDLIISDFHIACVQTGVVASQEMTWKFVRLDLFTKLLSNNTNHNLNNTCIEWLNLLTSDEGDEVEEQTVQDEGVRRGYEILNTDPNELPREEFVAYRRAQIAKHEMLETAKQLAKPMAEQMAEELTKQMVEQMAEELTKQMVEQLALAKFSEMTAAVRFVQERKLCGHDTTEKELMEGYGLMHQEAVTVLALALPVKEEGGE